MSMFYALMIDLVTLEVTVKSVDENLNLFSTLWAPVKFEGRETDQTIR